MFAEGAVSARDAAAADDHGRIICPWQRRGTNNAELRTKEGNNERSWRPTDQATAPRRRSRIHPRFFKLGLAAADRAALRRRRHHRHAAHRHARHHHQHLADRRARGHGAGAHSAAAFARYRSIHMQNLAQSAISAATFGAGNALLLPIGIPFVMGRPDLVPPLFAGVFLAMLLDGYLLYRMFDSEVFPAAGAWPPGVAAAEAISAGDEGGRKAVILGVGVVVGVAGNWLIATAHVGVRRRVHRQYLGADHVRHRPAGARLLGAAVHQLFASFFPGGDIAKAYVPHGMMVGAGIVALIQVAIIIMRRGHARTAHPLAPRARLPRCAARSAWAARSMC